MLLVAFKRNTSPAIDNKGIITGRNKGKSTKIKATFQKLNFFLTSHVPSPPINKRHSPAAV